MTMVRRDGKKLVHTTRHPKQVDLKGWAKAEIRWKRSSGDFVESHCGRWWIAPIYGGLTRPESYDLYCNEARTPGGWKVVGSGQTQRECKDDAEVLATSAR